MYVTSRAKGGAVSLFSRTLPPPAVEGVNSTPLSPGNPGTSAADHTTISTVGNLALTLTISGSSSCLVRPGPLQAQLRSSVIALPPRPRCISSALGLRRPRRQAQASPGRAPARPAGHDHDDHLHGESDRDRAADRHRVDACRAEQRCAHAAREVPLQRDRPAPRQAREGFGQQRRRSRASESAQAAPRPTPVPRTRSALLVSDANERPTKDRAHARSGRAAGARGPAPKVLLSRTAAEESTTPNLVELRASSVCRVVSWA